MDEQIIKFETAKLANEKGLELYSDLWYIETEAHIIVSHHNGDEYEYEFEPAHLSNECYHGKYDKKLYRAYSQTMVQKWLREKHKIEIYLEPYVVGKYTFNIFKMLNIIKIKYVGGRNVEDKNSRSKIFSSYEDALEAGLQEALKLI